MYDIAVVSAKGARRWQTGHPWIYRSDIVQRPTSPAAAVVVRDQRSKPIGVALWSPASEISLRMVDVDAGATLDHAWWRARIGDAVARREPLRSVANAYRLVHAEGDACPSLICDRYDRWLVVQLMSAGLEAFRDVIVDVLDEVTRPAGILARNDVPLRAKEQLPVGVEVLRGDVPDEIELPRQRPRQQAAQHVTAVEGRHRNHVEGGEHDIEADHPVEKYGQRRQKRRLQPA